MTRGAGFEPGFDNLQKDVERYLASVGKSTRTAAGMIVFHGYDDALRMLFGQYLERRALAPLVSHFRAWNWEYTYDPFLLDLTEALAAERDWGQLQRLWGAVIGKRRKLYNDLLKLRKRDPDAVGPEVLAGAKVRLLETLNRVRDMSADLGTPDDTSTYSRLIRNVEAERRA
jgi:hypothetical protein